MNFLSTIVGGLSSKAIMFIIAIVIAIGGTFIGMKLMHLKALEWQVQELLQENATLEANVDQLKLNNTTLKANQEILTKANDANYITAKKLDEERSASKLAIEALAQRQLRDQKYLDGLNKKIEDMMKDPNNDGPVAPILREIIRDIQKQKEQK